MGKRRGREEGREERGDFARRDDNEKGGKEDESLPLLTPLGSRREKGGRLSRESLFFSPLLSSSLLLSLISELPAPPPPLSFLKSLLELSASYSGHTCKNAPLRSQR